MITKAIRRLIGGLLWPVTRPLTVLLVWSQRHTLSLWGRSLAAELRRDGPIDLHRLAVLTRALWRVSTDSRMRHLAEIRTIGFDDDTIGDIGGDRDLRAATLRATLLDVPGVVAVEVVDPSGQSTQPAPVAA
jgi:hypothetical protein